MSSKTIKFRLINFDKSCYAQDLDNVYPLKIIKLIFNVKMVKYNFPSLVLYPIDCSEYEEAELQLRIEIEYSFNGCKFKIDLTSQSSFILSMTNRVKENLRIDNENKKIIFLTMVNLIYFTIYSAGAFRIKLFSINRKFDLDKTNLREYLTTKSTFYDYLEELEKYLENEDDC